MKAGVFEMADIRKTALAARSAARAAGHALATAHVPTHAVAAAIYAATAIRNAVEPASAEIARTERVRGSFSICLTCL